MLSPDELKRLRRHHNATLGLFIAIWFYALSVIGTIELAEVSKDMQRGLIGALFGGAVLLLPVQFARRCPNCKANLGWQLGLGIPKTCRKCGDVLRESDVDDSG